MTWKAYSFVKFVLSAGGRQAPPFSPTRVALTSVPHFEFLLLIDQTQLCNIHYRDQHEGLHCSCLVLKWRFFRNMNLPTTATKWPRHASWTVDQK